LTNILEENHLGKTILMENDENKLGDVIAECIKGKRHRLRKTLKESHLKNHPYETTFRPSLENNP